MITRSYCFQSHFKREAGFTNGRWSTNRNGAHFLLVILLMTACLKLNFQSKSIFQNKMSQLTNVTIFMCSYFLLLTSVAKNKKQKQKPDKPCFGKLTTKKKVINLKGRQSEHELYYFYMCYNLSVSKRSARQMSVRQERESVTVVNLA